MDRYHDRTVTRDYILEALFLDNSKQAWTQTIGRGRSSNLLAPPVSLGRLKVENNCLLLRVFWDRPPVRLAFGIDSAYDSLDDSSELSGAVYRYGFRFCRPHPRAF